MNIRFQKMCLPVFLLAFIIHASPATATQSRAQQRMAAFLAANNASPPTPQAAQSTNSESPVKVFRGNGSQSTSPFTISTPFIVAWEAHEWTWVAVYLASGQVVQFGSSEESGQVYVPKGGTYYLDIGSTGKWKVKVLPR